ncbi:pimeloyl-ACP methyl ester carboxylesterase [Allocatelliglobosispora scoriae]|uniref:Pimeloyl-ACP methyl ester carboxylesterase n=1 Tax=Allocatelliglobosispora scoriae TaxID=643052 RepID=A0A841BJL6_9ACTN|nr:alpha/beta hydrolase [Allocatelliglobosispora scoriae]MBB5867010.1 pimeloyl-ACP methyl ester carboxylesterase [Allocatelliglobosispora scoriae]
MIFQPGKAELAFTGAGNRLVGDVVTPPWPGPHPGVVFVEGSGPGGRDLGDWPVRLAAAGLASLAYDKPGSGASTGDWTTQSLDDRARETVAAVRALRGHPAVAGAPVALIGGSQGGWVAQLAAAADQGIAAVVTVSGPGVGVAAQEEYRLRHQLPAYGFGADTVETALALLAAQLRPGADPAAVHAHQVRWQGEGWYPLLAGTTPASIAFLARIAGHDPEPVLARLRCPLLLVFGGDDVLVPVDDSVRAVERILSSTGHPDFTTVVFPGADHAVRLGTGERAPGFDEFVTGWLRRRLSPA